MKKARVPIPFQMKDDSARLLNNPLRLIRLAQEAMFFIWLFTSNLISLQASGSFGPPWAYQSGGLDLVSLPTELLPVAGVLLGWRIRRRLSDPAKRDWRFWLSIFIGLSLMIVNRVIARYGANTYGF